MDCKTIFFFLGIIALYFLYKFVDKYFAWLMGGGMLILRSIFVIVIILLLGGTPGLPDELFIGAGWAALEFFLGSIKNRRDSEDDEQDEDDVTDDEEE